MISLSSAHVTVRVFYIDSPQGSFGFLSTAVSPPLSLALSLSLSPILYPFLYLILLTLPCQCSPYHSVNLWGIFLRLFPCLPSCFISPLCLVSLRTCQLQVQSPPFSIIPASLPCLSPLPLSLCLSLSAIPVPSPFPLLSHVRPRSDFARAG